MTQASEVLPAPGGVPDRRGATLRLHPGMLAPYALPALLVIAIATFSVLRPDTFATTANLQTTLQSVAINLVVAVALIIPLVTERFDLSVGSNIGISGVILGQLMAHEGWALVPAVAAALAVGLAIGVVNGFFVAYLQVDSLIVTLGTATMLTGLTTWLSNGELITQGLSPKLTDIGLNKMLGIPEVFLIAAAVALIAWFVISQTVFGRNLGAIGSNEESAILVGINTRRAVFATFLIAGALGAFAGILEVGNQGVSDPSVGGIDLLLPALAGTFLSVSAFTPGRYNIPGAFVGLLFISVTVSGLAYLGAPSWIQPVFNGAAVVVAVTISTLLHRRAAGR
jgi:ribose transport system permease protein